MRIFVVFRTRTYGYSARGSAFTAAADLKSRDPLATVRPYSNGTYRYLYGFFDYSGVVSLLDTGLSSKYTIHMFIDKSSKPKRRGNAAKTLWHGW